MKLKLAKNDQKFSHFLELLGDRLEVCVSVLTNTKVNIRVKSWTGVLMSTLMTHSSFGSALALSPAGSDFVLSSSCINKYQGKYKSEIINRCIDVNINGPLFLWLSFGFISCWY